MKVSQINYGLTKQISFQAGKITYYSQTPEEYYSSPPKPGGKLENYKIYHKNLNNYLKLYKNNVSYIKTSNYDLMYKYIEVATYQAQPTKILAKRGTEILEKTDETLKETDETLRLKNHIKKNSSWNLEKIIQNIGDVLKKYNLKQNPTSPNDLIIAISLWGKDKKLIPEIEQDLQNSLKKENIKFGFEIWKDNFTHNIGIVPITDTGENFSQSYHIKKALKEAKMNNDLVVINSWEDAANPFLYLKDYSDKTSSDTIRKNYTTLKNNPKQLIKLLQEHQEKYSDIIKEFNELPLIILSNEDIKEKNGIKQKYIKLNKNKISSALNNATRIFAKENKEFRKNIPLSMLIPIKKIVGTVLAAGIIRGGSACLKKAVKNENKEH